ncbi:MAG TPA: rod shape-determining protein MreD [Chloroflexi bacterium]|nr:rod shape-determining protein MreD [Chloroflexota bacterium]
MMALAGVSSTSGSGKASSHIWQRCWNRACRTRRNSSARSASEADEPGGESATAWYHRQNVETGERSCTHRLGRLGTRAPRSHPDMTRVFFGLSLALVAMLQASFVPALGLIAIQPDLALILLLAWSASRGMAEGMAWALGLGIWLDLLTLDPLGTHAFSLLVVAVIGGLAGQRIFRSGIVLPIVLVVVATLASGLVASLVARFSGDAAGGLEMMRPIVAAVFLNTMFVLVGWVVLLIVDRWIPRHV